MTLFKQQWAVYSKLVEHNHLHHREVGAAIRSAVAAMGGASLRLLELACGDAAMTVNALKGLPLAHYTGVDFSVQALALAANNLEQLDCEVRLVENDFVEAVRSHDSKVDVVLVSLSLHHLETDRKGEVMTEARRVLADGGILLVYEPTCLHGEGRDRWLERFHDNGAQNWTSLAAHEWRDVWNHARGNDYPESENTWMALARNAGFAGGEELYAAPDDLTRLFCFRA